MVYISPDGSLHQSRPFGISTIIYYFWGILNFTYAFFKSLINPGSDSGDHSDSGRSSWGGYSGPGGPGGPRRRIGRIPPPSCNIPGGGCAGGSCSR